MKHPINYEAWAESLIGFIRSRGLESDLKDYCGGWPCPISLSEKRTQIAVAAWITARGYATGHGDTLEELLAELEASAKERGAKGK